MLTPEVIEVLQELLINNFFLIMKRNLDLFLSSSTSKDSCISFVSFLNGISCYENMSMASNFQELQQETRKGRGRGLYLFFHSLGLFSSSVLSLHSSALNFSISMASFLHSELVVFQKSRAEN